MQFRSKFAELDVSFIIVDTTQMLIRCKFDEVRRNLDEFRCNLDATQMQLRYNFDALKCNLDATQT